MTDISHLMHFLKCPTPAAWLERARASLPLLLIDHAHCEKKAAATALNLMYRYPDKADLQHQLSRLAREELRHFEQVLELMAPRGVRFGALSPSRYAQSLRVHVRKTDPHQFVDLMICGALIEARSCERFSALAEVIDDEELAQYYRFLLRSESRHFENYLGLAKRYAGAEEASSIGERIALFTEVEAELINSPDERFRFHSGIPI